MSKKGRWTSTGINEKMTLVFYEKEFDKRVAFRVYNEFTDEVIEPQSVRERLKKRVENIQEKYIT